MPVYQKCTRHFLLSILLGQQCSLRNVAATFLNFMEYFKPPLNDHVQNIAMKISTSVVSELEVKTNYHFTMGR